MHVVTPVHKLSEIEQTFARLLLIDKNADRASL